MSHATAHHSTAWSSSWDPDKPRVKVTLPRVPGATGGAGYVTVPFVVDDDRRGAHMRELVYSRRNGDPPTRAWRKWSPEDLDELALMRLAGTAWPDIADRFGTSTMGVEQAYQRWKRNMRKIQAAHEGAA